MLSDCQILLVEDEACIAFELMMTLTREGAIVLGPAQSLSDGLCLCTRASIDCAILDIKLCDGDSFEIADALADHGVPFVFMTGYSDHPIPARHREQPVIRKPFAIAEMAQTVAELVAERKHSKFEPAGIQS
ncbi:MAG TPA: response regulator [Verrucomicrobiae bacterium]|jgi:DNA-binding NtrC family response regulator|nr:response regulator [Verrucomicrobiae bacterium]